MTSARLAVIIGLLVCIPIVVWIAGNVLLLERLDEPAAGAARAGAGVLWTVLAAAITLLGPWCAPFYKPRETLVAIVVLVLTPLPLFLVCWLMGGGEVRVLGLAYVALFVLSLVATGAGYGIGRLLKEKFVNTLGTVTLQATLTITTVSFADRILAWFVG